MQPQSRLEKNSVFNNGITKSDMYKSIVYGVFIKAFNCQINHQVKTRCTDFPEGAGNCTKGFLVLSHCAILDANGEVYDEKKCECSFDKLGNIFLPKNCTEICQNFINTIRTNCDGPSQFFKIFLELELLERGLNNGSVVIFRVHFA